MHVPFLRGRRSTGAVPPIVGELALAVYRCNDEFLSRVTR